MDKAICFDLGNVLVRVDLEKFYNKLPLSLKDIVVAMQAQQDVGLVTIQDIAKLAPGMFHSFGDQIEEVWNSTIEPSKTMFGIVEMFLEQGYSVAILSNIGLEHAAYLRKHPVCRAVFEESILHFSCEVGARKPTKLYYQSFLQDYPIFVNSVFFDDRPENIASCSPLTGVHFNLNDYENEEQASLALVKKYIDNRR